MTDIHMMQMSDAGRQELQIVLNPVDRSWSRGRRKLMRITDMKSFRYEPSATFSIVVGNIAKDQGELR